MHRAVKTTCQTSPNFLCISTVAKVQSSNKYLLWVARGVTLEETAGPDPSLFEIRDGPTLCDHLVPKYKNSETQSLVYSERVHCVVQMRQYTEVLMKKESNHKNNKINWIDVNCDFHKSCYTLPSLNNLFSKMQFDWVKLFLKYATTVYRLSFYIWIIIWYLYHTVFKKWHIWFVVYSIFTDITFPRKFSMQPWGRLPPHLTTLSNLKIQNSAVFQKRPIRHFILSFSNINQSSQ